MQHRSVASEHYELRQGVVQVEGDSCCILTDTVPSLS